MNIYMCIVYLEVAVSVADKDMERLIIAELSVASPPLNLWHRVGVHVACDVVCRPGPDVYVPRMLATKTRLV